MQAEVFYNDDPDIQMWEVTGPGIVGSRHRLKRRAVEKAKKVMRNTDHITGVQVHKKNGAVQRTIGDAQPI